MTFILGDELRDLLYDDGQKQEVLDLAANKRWDEIDRIGVFPLRQSHVHPITVDLTVGAEVYLHRDGERHKLGETSMAIAIEPGDTAIVLTRESIVAPADIGGIVLTKATFVWEGMSQGTTKIDPTWYGCLHVTITNMTRNSVEIRYGEPFCSVMFFRLPAPVAQPLDVDHLGQEAIMFIPRRAKPWSIRTPDEVSNVDFERAVQKYGPPFDLIRAMFKWQSESLISELNSAIVPALRVGLLSDLSQKRLSRAEKVIIALVSALVGALLALITALLLQLGHVQ